MDVNRIVAVVEDGVILESELITQISNIKAKNYRIGHTASTG